MCVQSNLQAKNQTVKENKDLTKNTSVEKQPDVKCPDTKYANQVTLLRVPEPESPCPLALVGCAFIFKAVAGMGEMEVGLFAGDDAGPLPGNQVVAGVIGEVDKRVFNDLEIG